MFVLLESIHFNLTYNNESICLGYHIILECSVFENGTIVFTGSALNCPATNNEIVLTAGRNSSKSCNGGLIFGYNKPRIGDNRLHNTLLNVTLTSDIIGHTITCSYDNGTTQEVIGDYTVMASHNCAYTTAASTSSNTSSGHINVHY